MPLDMKMVRIAGFYGGGVSVAHHREIRHAIRRKGRRERGRHRGVVKIEIAGGGGGSGCGDGGRLHFNTGEEQATFLMNAVSFCR